MIKKTLKFVLFLVFPLITHGQVIRKCAVGEKTSESQKLRENSFNQKVTEYIVKNGRQRVNESEILKIPVVIHIIHNNAAGTIGGAKNSNISDDQVFSQIKVLNEDYRKKIGTLGYNTSPIGADMGLEFVLANTDPENKSSTGINRVYSPKKKFDVFNDNTLLSSLSYWDSNKYLNIWVTNLANDYIGYGEFPGAAIDGLELADVDEKIDGIIIDNTVFGKKVGTATNGIYTSGRTLTHEIGHWLGLIHIWGDEFCGNDYVSDTPTTEKANLSIDCKSTFSNCSGIKTLNMIENFLDYTPDTCMNIFTNGQKTRVRAVLELSKRRKRLIENAKFNLKSTENLEVALIENPNNSNFIQFQVLLNGYKNFSFILYDNLGRILKESSYLDSPSRQIQLVKTGFPRGVVILKVFTDSESITKKVILP